MRRSNQELDAIDIGLEMGMGRVTATMSAPFMWFTPATVDPYSPVVIMMVESIQHTLGEMGIATRKDGFVDAKTSAAFRSISGPRWKNKAWIQVFSDILDAKQMGIKHKEKNVAYALSGLGADLIGPELPPDWKTVAGVCRPQTPQMLSIFEKLQRQVNRVLTSMGKPTIAEDGRIGKQTMAAVNTTLGRSYKSCEAVARVADMLSEEARRKANKLAVPLYVYSPPPKQPKSRVNPATNEVVNPPVPWTDRVFHHATSPLGMGVIGIATVVGIRRYREKGKLF